MLFVGEDTQWRRHWDVAGFSRRHCNSPVEVSVVTDLLKHIQGPRFGLSLPAAHRQFEMFVRSFDPSFSFLPSAPGKAERDESKMRPLSMSLLQAPGRPCRKHGKRSARLYARTLLHVSLYEFFQDSQQTTTCRKQSVGSGLLGGGVLRVDARRSAARQDGSIAEPACRGKPVLRHGFARRGGRRERRRQEYGGGSGSATESGGMSRSG